MKQIGFLLLLLCVSFSLNIYGTVEAIPLSKVFGYLGSTFSFALDIFGFIDSLDDGKTPIDDKKTEELKNELSARIDASTKSIIANINLHVHFSRLLEITEDIRFLLTEIENIMESTDTKTRDENIRRFENGFKEHEADIQKIAQLLTVTIPINGISKPLIDMFSELVGCSLKRLQEFEDYYMKMVSSAFAIDVTNERFSNFDLSNKTAAFWSEKEKNLTRQFILRRQQCIARFPQLVKDDLEGDENATDLQRNNAHRYSGKLNNVVYVDRDTDCDIKYLEQDNYIFFNTTSPKRKILFFERKNKIVETLDFNSTRTDDSYTKVFPTDRDMSRLLRRINEGKCEMKIISKMIKDLFFWRGYTLRFWLILNSNPDNEIAIFCFLLNPYRKDDDQSER